MPRRPFIYEIAMLILGLLMTAAGLLAFMIARDWKTLVGFLFFGVCSLSSVSTLRHLQRERRREKWLASGCCPKCGYDLRDTPLKCPECGYDAPKPMVWSGSEFDR